MQKAESNKMKNIFIITKREFLTQVKKKSFIILTLLAPILLIGFGALIAFMLDIHIQEHGYTEIMPPYLVKRSLMEGAGQLPKFEDQAYLCAEDELYLNPTAEVPLVGLHSDSILPPGTLPLRYVAWTSAFRREVGSAARQKRGLQRLH